MDKPANTDRLINPAPIYLRDGDSDTEELAKCSDVMIALSLIGVVLVLFHYIIILGQFHMSLANLKSIGQYD